MLKQAATAIKMAIATIFILSVAYPLLTTGIAQVIFPKQANGSLVTAEGRVVGSRLIAQGFTKAGYFHPRPSAAGANGYDATASGGSNLGPTSKTLVDRVKGDVDKAKKENPGLTGSVPVDMVTTSGSGLDPDITPANAYAQAERIAKARGIDKARVEELIAKNETGRQFGILGEPRVNVLDLNLVLDAEFGTPKK